MWQKPEMHWKEKGEKSQCTNFDVCNFTRNPNPQRLLVRIHILSASLHRHFLPGQNNWILCLTSYYRVGDAHYCSCHLFRDYQSFHRCHSAQNITLYKSHQRNKQTNKYSTIERTYSYVCCVIKTKMLAEKIK